MVDRPAVGSNLRWDSDRALWGTVHMKMVEHFNASEWLVDRHVVAGDGARIAIRCQRASTTYAELHDQVVGAAAALRAHGVRPEERVALAMLDSVEFAVAYLASMRIGAVPVLMNPLLPGRDLAVIAADSRARIAIMSQERLTVLEDFRAGADEIATIISTGPSGDDVIGWSDFVAASDAGDADGLLYTTSGESPGFWLCTSGSTGRPKLAAHRHADVKTVCDTVGHHMFGISPEDRFFSVGPMFHAYGLGNSLLFPLSQGATAILEPTRPPTPQLVADIVADEHPTLFFCVPTFYAALCNADVPADTFASVRFGVSAAEPLPAGTVERFKEKFGVTVLDGIGSTEMLHIYLGNTPTSIRAGTSGVPIPGYEVRVVDENGVDQAAGEPGELWVKGDSMTTGYWCRSAVNRATFQGEWMRTGDLYSRDTDGFYTYLGRVDDMLRVGGEWVSPAEVEGALIEHATVLEAAVVGERDEAQVLRPIAYVIGAPDAEVDAEVLDQHCRDRLAGYKRPKRYEIVTELPKTATGKIQRYRLRE